MNNAKELMFSLIKSQIFGEEVVFPESIDRETLFKLYQLSKKHDVAHIVAAGLEKHSIVNDENIKKAFNKEKMMAVFRREQQNFESKRIFEVLEDAEIDHLPLKGSVIKDHYPEDWMRTSCDIDILIRSEDLDKAVSVITEKLDFRFEGKTRQDVSLVSKSGVNLELHFTIKSPLDELNVIFDKIWNHTVLCNETKHCFGLTKEFLLFYNVAHMKYHFAFGGCGVRPFIDLKLLENALDYSENEFMILIEKGGCSEFYKGITELSKTWFDGKEQTELSEMMEEFILTGGVFGTKKNFGAADRYLHKNKFGYLISRIFISKERLVNMYPLCGKYPLLLPFYQVKRWFRIFKKDVSSAAKNELKGGENAEKTALMMEKLGF